MKTVKPAHPKLSKEQEAAILKKVIDKCKEDIALLVYKDTPFIASAKVKIEFMQRRSILDLFLKETKYELFQWCLEHDNLELIHKLIERCTERRRFLMISDNDYAVFKKYVQNILVLSPEEYMKVFPIKCPILKEIIVVNPLYIGELIKKIVEENKGQPVATIFLQDMQKIAVELTPANGDISLDAFSPQMFFSPAPLDEKVEHKENELHSKNRIGFEESICQPLNRK